jgi:hydroxyethylthiazole kinase-like uncharacterized protein yjeF
MIKIVTSAEMRKIDRMTIEEVGIPGAVLMERAGLGCFEVLKKYLCHLKDPLVYIFCGKGNNGGDGFVIARYLWDMGIRIKILIVGKEKDIKNDAKINFDILKMLKLPYQFIDSLPELKKITKVPPDVVIDALLGTGITGPVYGFMQEVIKYINRLNVFTFAVDIPSGLNVDIPIVEGEAVRANVTATMALPKRCHIFYPAKSQVGDLHLVDIGIPHSVGNSNTVKIQLIEKRDIHLPERAIDAHKYECGKVAVLAGSTGYTGAAALTAQGALHIGAGLVILGIPGILNSVLETKLTEVITKPYFLGRSGHLTSADDPDIIDLLDWCDVLAIGPGLGRMEETQRSVIDILTGVKKPTVIDADALFALAQEPLLLKTSHPNWILTPHHGEFLRFLAGISKSDFRRDIISLAQKFAEKNELVLLLKGAPSLVASPDGQVYVNSTGNSGLASGGTGDVLTGFVAGLVGQGLDLVESSITANYLHGACADIIKKDKTEYALTAGDLIVKIGDILKEITEYDN